MEKEKSFFRKLQENKRKQVVFCVVSTLVISVMYLLGKHMVELQREHSFTIVPDNFTWVYQIDSMECEDNKLVISGWAFALEQDAGENKFEIVLHNLETEKDIFPKIRYEAREDVNAYFLCKYDYTQSGFTATCSEKRLDDGVYEILLKPEGSKNVYSTGIYYADGTMSFVNPEEFTPLDVAETNLELIVEQGILRVYRQDYGMYVYQYEGELYWIAEKWYDFVNGDTFVQYQMNTTQVENLPQNRLDNGWYWSNISFYFTKNELLDWDTGRYRVTKCALPTEYSVTQIWTGNYIDGWIWSTSFRPWYEFSTEA